MALAAKILELLLTIGEWALAKDEAKKAELRAKADKQYNELFDFMDGADGRLDAQLAAARKIVEERRAAAGMTPEAKSDGPVAPPPVIAPDAPAKE